MNSEILYITRRLGFPSSFGVRSGLGDFLEQYPDGIYAETGIGAPIGWESAAVWFGGESERVAARFERMVAERNDVSRLFRTRVAGTLVITFLYRLKKRAFTAVPVGGGAEPEPPTIDFWGLKLTMPQGGNIILRKNGSPNEISLEISLDGVNWSQWELDGTSYSYQLNAGQTLCVRNTISDHVVSLMKDLTNYYHFVFETEVYASGSVMSMVCNDENRVSLGNVSYCFGHLFDGCDKLITAPELPATILSGSCYYYMFKGCSGLRVAPTLPAQAVKASSYGWMFYMCTSLESAPELPATTIAQQCYYHMFHGCTSLIHAPATLPATTLYSKCYEGMFDSCGISESPLLPATVLNTSSYATMLRNCKSLKTVRTLMTDISASSCLNNWLYNVSATGDFYCPASLTIPTGASGIPSGWTRHDI